MARPVNTKTKENILFQAFILFSKKPYDKVTFEDLEKATGLSRGALLYHVKTKMNLFNEVIESSLLNRSSILNIPIRDKDCLKNFILDFVNNCEQTMKTMISYGIKNINLAYFNIESQALYYYTNYNKISKQGFATDVKVWEQVINRAIEKEEVKHDIDVEILALLFQKTYLGHAYNAVSEEKGCDVTLLQKELLSIYDFVTLNM